MLNYLVKKYNLNVTSMIRNGTVAVITMIGVAILFGMKNVMIAFPIALTSTVIGRQNFYVKPINRVWRILLLDLVIVLIAFLSSLNIWTGVIIDFFAIFLLIYIVTSPYDATLYKPFIMLYVFTQYSSISIYELPNRLLSVVFGALVIIAGTYIKRSKGKEIIGNSVKSAFFNIENQIENIIENIKNSNPDLILLDINLPIFDGYYICREIRKFSETPIIVVTSRDSDVDELMSMNLGADDFVTKPYNTQILLARIESILKRVNRNLGVQDILEYKDIKVNLANGTVTYNNKTIEITKNELKILSYLMKNKGKIVPREKLMNYLWDCEMFIDDNTLSVNVTRIRKKLEEIGVKDVIETRRGLGYIIS